MVGSVLHIQRTLLIALAVMLTFFASNAIASTACTSATNVSGSEILGFSLNGVQYTVTENFVTPDYAGITVNGKSYTLYPNSSSTIDQNTGSYVELAQINYIPIQPSVNLILCSGAQKADTYYTFNISDNNYGDLYFPYFGTRIVISSDSIMDVPTNVTIINATDSSGGSPQGYTKLIALNIAVVSSATTTMNVTQRIPCYLSAANTTVYEIENGAWQRLYGLAFNTAACTVSFMVAADPIVGVFYASPKTTSTTAKTTSTTTKATSISTSTKPTTTVPKSSSTATSTLKTTTRPTSTYSTTTVEPKNSSLATIAGNITAQINSYIPANYLAAARSDEGIAQAIVSANPAAIGEAEEAIGALALIIIALVSYIVLVNSRKRMRDLENSRKSSSKGKKKAE